MTSQQREAAFWTLTLALAIYVSPVVLGSVWAAFRALDGESFVGQTLLTLIASPAGPFAVVLKDVLLPLTAAISTATLWSQPFLKRTVFLFVLTAIGCVCAGYLFFYLNLLDHARDLIQSDQNTLYKKVGDFHGAKDRYFGGFIESLITYIGVLLGVQFMDKTDQKQPNNEPGKGG